MALRGLPRGQLVQRTSMVVVALLVGHFLLKLHVVHEHLFHHMPHVAYGESLYREDHFHHDVNPHESNLLDALAALATAPHDDDDDAESILTLPLEPGHIAPQAMKSLAVEPVQQTVNAQTGVHTEPVQSASSPPPVPAAAKAKDVFGDFLPPPPASIMLTFGSKSVADFILNWVKNVERIDNIGPYIVACLDQALLDLCREHNIPAFYARSAEIIGDRQNLGSNAEKQEKQNIGADRYYRTDGAAFKKMGAVKAATLQMMLETGYNIFISDADVVWFGNPWPVVGGRKDIPVRPDSIHLATADVLASTDCIDFLEDMGPGIAGHEQNTGMLFLRATAAAVEFTIEWQRRALETTDGHDQTEYNRILKGVYLPGKPGKAFVDMAPWPYLPTMIDTGKEGEEPRPTHPDKDLRRVRNGQLGIHPELTSKAWDTFNSNKARGIRNTYWMWHGQIKVGLLPMGEFLNGHLFFTRRLQEYSGIKPIATHLTYQFGDTADYVYGKRQRLREHGIWLMEEDSYFTDGNFLHIVDPEEGYKHIIDQYAPVARVCKETDPVQSKCWHGENLVKKSIEEGVSPRNPEAYTDPCKPHLEVQGWLRGALRNGIVLSRLLNRTLVLPRLDCYCERHWWLLNDGRIPAGRSQMPMPYQCPMDHIFEPSEWFAERGLLQGHFREPSFLRNPRVPEAVKQSSMQLTLTGKADPSWDEKSEVLTMQEGSTFEQVKVQLGRLKDQGVEKRVIEIKAATLRDLFALCAPITHFPDVPKLNQQLRDLLDGRLVEFCGQERNTLLHETAPIMERQGFDAKKSLNCSYPGKWPVTANPVEWAQKITTENRQAWIGEPLQDCTAKP